MAAGFSLEEDKIEEFRQFVGEYVRAQIGHEAITPVIEVDGVLDLAGADQSLMDKLELLEPYGAGNSEPKLVLQRVRVSKARIVGSGHVSCFLSSANGGSMKAMAFPRGRYCHWPGIAEQQRSRFQRCRRPAPG